MEKLSGVMDDWAVNQLRLELYTKPDTLLRKKLLWLIDSHYKLADHVKKIEKANPELIGGLMRSDIVISEVNFPEITEQRSYKIVISDGTFCPEVTKQLNLGTINGSVVIEKFNGPPEMIANGLSEEEKKKLCELKIGETIFIVDNEIVVTRLT